MLFCINNFLATPLLAKPSYLIGRSIVDITGRPLGAQMSGYSKKGQITNGIHLRQYARAFVIVNESTGKRFVLVTADMCHIDHNINLGVIENLQKKKVNDYTIKNLLLSSTHTHSGPHGYRPIRRVYALAKNFDKEYFDFLASKIAHAVLLAHKDLSRGKVYINQGIIEGTGINRSLIAYMQNPENERNQYKFNIDKEMTLLKFTKNNKNIGLHNWHAVHATSMTYDNQLISGDHKGYASKKFEQNQGNGFVASFAQSNAGDVTSNLNLDNTGPGKNDFESTQIIGERQYQGALGLNDAAIEQIQGPIDYRQIYINLSNFKISGKYTDGKNRTTCPSAFGYSYAAGSTEDGGGHFLFWEGMRSSNFILDWLITLLGGARENTKEVEDCQYPKPILFQTGTGLPPRVSQIRSVSIFRLGQLAIITIPGEVTTMAGRRIRNVVKNALGPWVKYVVLAGYANGAAGYITTPEEYSLQQYEGGHTLHGKYTLSAYLQASEGLANLIENKPSRLKNYPKTIFDDWREKSQGIKIYPEPKNEISENKKLGSSITKIKRSFLPGETFTFQFLSTHPGFPTLESYLEVQFQNKNFWQPIANDSHWSTKISWEKKGKKHIATIHWEIPNDIKIGNYRILHKGQYFKAGQRKIFTGKSPVFQLKQKL